jgi:anhydro-N-acetylmuramic acid kinase
LGLFVGVMSGTSMDAVDCALVDFKAEAPRLVADHSEPWPDTLRERLQAAAAGAPLDAAGLGRLDTATGRFIADTVTALLERADVPAGRVRAIGSHGQTIAHDPDGDEPATVQLGDASVIAERTGIATVTDFRRRDLAAGGQGAPLAPVFHDAVLRSAEEDRAVLNLGGIANLTVLPAAPDRPVIGFDSGPANCLMDLWVREQRGRPCDDGGRWAASATPAPELLARLLDDPYFALPPPKSTGTQYFSRRWLHQRLAGLESLTPATVQATLLALTLTTVADAIERHAPSCQRVLVCGGGVDNAALVARLAQRLARPVESTAGHGIDPRWMEPMAFAWLAQRTLQGLPGNLPSVTGAAGARILGTVHPA